MIDTEKNATSAKKQQQQQSMQVGNNQQHKPHQIVAIRPQQTQQSNRTGSNKVQIQGANISTSNGVELKRISTAPAGQNERPSNAGVAKRNGSTNNVKPQHVVKLSQISQQQERQQQQENSAMNYSELQQKLKKQTRAGVTKQHDNFAMAPGAMIHLQQQAGKPQQPGLKSQLLNNNGSDQVYMRQPAATLVQPKRSSVGLSGLASNQLSDSESPTMQRKIPPSTQNGARPLNFMSDQQDPLHTIKTEFDLQPNVRNPVNFSQAGIHSAQHMSRKKRINHQGIGGGYLSEAVDGPNNIGNNVADRKNQRSHTSGGNNAGHPQTGNKTLTTNYGKPQQVVAHGGEEKQIRGGSLSYANHKYNQSASGIKRGSTAPGGQGAGAPNINRGDLSLSFAKGGGPLDTSMTIQGGTRHQYNVSSDLTVNQQVLQHKFKPRAISSTVSKNIANKKVKLNQNKTPIFHSNYLEQQQPKIKNKLQTLIGEGFGQPVVPVVDSDGQVFQQYEQWQRPPSRQKEPHRAQNLDDINPKNSDRQSWKMQSQIHSGMPQGVSTNGMRPRIDFFHHRITGSSEFANQYAAMNYNQMRPPSRHKDLPQGLELPPDDQDEGDIPSVDSDSDSLDEFEIGIQNAQSHPKRGGKKMSSFEKRGGAPPQGKTFQPFVPLNDQNMQGLNRDSSDEDEEAQACESELLFTDNPTLKDFLNLSNGGSRFIKATQDARRGTGPSTVGPQQTQKGQPQSYTANNFYVHKGKTPTQAALQEAVADNIGNNNLAKPRSAAGNRIVSQKNRIRVAQGAGNAVGLNNVLHPPGTAQQANNLITDNTKGGQRKNYSKTLGRGGWPTTDPLHDPPMQIEAFRQPAVGTDQQPSGAKTTFHTHQHSLMGMENNFNKRGSEDDMGRASGADGDLQQNFVAAPGQGASSYLGRQTSSTAGGQVAPGTSSSQMIFGKRPPEARGNRNKILSAGGSSNTFYKSTMLANANRVGGAAPQQDNSNSLTGSGTTAAGASTNLQEFYSPRPVNNNGVGELKTSKSGDKNESNISQNLAGKSAHKIMFTMTGKHDLHGEETALSDDHDLSSLIASSNLQNQGGLKSQTLQFATALGHDFLDLFAKEDGEDDDDEQADE